MEGERSRFIDGKKRKRKRPVEREGEKRKKLKLLSSIYGVPSVGIRRVKNESSSTRRWLHVSTKKEGFHLRSKGGDFRKSKFSGLGGVLETSFGSNTLQEVGIPPTLVILHSKGCLVVYYALRGCS